MIRSLSTLAAMAGLALLPASPGAVAGDSSSARLEVPITRTVLSNGEARYSIPLRIGDSPPINAMLDTGSIGLRVLSRAIPGLAAAPASAHSQYGYGSGVRITGAIVAKMVTIGSATTDDAVPIQVVQRVDCFERQPNCPASRVSQAEYGFGGDGLPQEGFDAIIGIALWPEPAHDGPVNPLAHLGARRWIVELPLPNADPNSGRLILNPTGDDLRNFTLFDQLTALPGFQTEAIAGCLVNESVGRQFCGPIFFDTGSTPVHVYTSQVSPRNWTPGMRGHFSLEGMPTTTADFAVRPGLIASYVSVSPQVGPRPVLISVGPLAFFKWAVLYDSTREMIGLRPR